MRSTATPSPSPTPSPLPTGTADVGDNKFATAFETDDNERGYVVESLILDIPQPPPMPANVMTSLWSSDSQLPFARLLTFRNPADFQTGENTFEAPDDAPNLEPLTTYFVIVENIPDVEIYSIRTTANTSPAGRILRIEPGINAVTLRSGDPVKLAINLYGRQNILNRNLAGSVEFQWRVEAHGDGSSRSGSFHTETGLPDGPEVIYIAPETPGRYTVNATIDTPGACFSKTADETTEEGQQRCTASFDITVLMRRVDSSRVSEPPVNPAGPIPIVIAGTAGTQHAVFTPEDGGTATSPTEMCTLTAPPAAIQNNELIGIAINELLSPTTSSVIPADAATQIYADPRFIQRGIICNIEAVDSEGNAVHDYFLNQSAEICLPLPPEFRTVITDAAIAHIEAGAVSQQLGSSVRITANTGDVIICGKITQLPATAAAIIPANALPDQPATQPDPTPTAPDAGPFRAPPTATLIFLLILGTATATAAFVIKRTAN